MRIRTRAIAAAALVLLLRGSLGADVSTATLTGAVKDESGAVLPGATITVVNEKQGTAVTATTDGRGEYRVPLLRPDVYTIRCELAGFRPDSNPGVALAVGSTARIDFTLKVGGVSESVGATAEAPLVDATSSEVGGNITPTQIQALPLNGRNYLELALLTPGTSFARDGNSPLAFGAQEGRAINVQVDGIENNDESIGGQLLDINQDTVQEFQVISSQFTAEYGKASGGIISVITKSGTNDPHGSAYYYLRRDSLDAHDFWAAEQPELKQDNFGATIGGPILKNRTFFFLSADYNKKQQATTVDTFGARPDLEGTFPLPNKKTLVSAKIDHNFTDNQHLSVAYRLDNSDQGNLGVGGIYAESYGYAKKRNAWAVNASLNSVFSGKSYNELRGSFQYNKTDYVANSNQVSEHHPDYYIGQNYFMPQGGLDRRYQFADNYSTYFSWLGDHQLKLGASYAHWYESYNFPLTSGGSVYYNDDTPGDDPAADPYLYQKGYGDPRARPDVKFYSAFLQDQWRLRNLTVNLGVRYDYYPGTANADFRSAFPFIPSAQEDKTQFSPRFGFAWDPGGDGRSVFRGGAGIFYYQLYNNLALDQDVFNGTTYKIAAYDCSVDRSLCDLGNLPDPTLGPTQPPLIRTLAPNIKTPYTIQYSLGYQRQLGQTWSVGMDLLYIRGLHELYERDLNVDPVLYPDVGRIRQVESDASSDYKALEISILHRFSQNFQMQVAYTLSKAVNETDGFFLPIPDSSKPISFQKGPAPSDQRHRFVLNAAYNLPLGFQVGGIWKLASGQPWNAVITGGDTNGDGARGDRLPGDSRNSQISNTYNRVDLRLSKLFNLGPVGLTLIGEVFNVFNRRNNDPGGIGFPGGYVNNRCLSADVTESGQCVDPNPDFGAPGPPSFPDNYSQRELQLAVRLTF